MSQQYFSQPTDRRHTQPVIDALQYTPPASTADKPQDKKDAADTASVMTTSTFASTKALLKDRFFKSGSGSSGSAGSSSSNKDKKPTDADRKRAEEEARLMRAQVRFSS
ncbi:hypothetical protein NKR23_g11683 [Pleurostoma richardsiae]|uniref:Uncharacterized protein n=1 Tax=Pleurostoma richardsiae TaxID=41990 RepID=A0AA38R2P9_9PEZI|nr:hypothetical protein NKR23_g11683 [Pleurostoma richardsiae]